MWMGPSVLPAMGRRIWEGSWSCCTMGCLPPPRRRCTSLPYPMVTVQNSTKSIMPHFSYTSMRPLFDGPDLFLTPSAWYLADSHPPLSGPRLSLGKEDQEAGSSPIPSDGETKSSGSSRPAITIDPLPMCQFTVPHKALKPGESLVLCGDIPELGSWDPSKGLKLNWQPGDSWVGKIRLPAKVTFDAKVSDV